MNQYNKSIENQYHVPDLFENIVKRLKKQGIDIRNVSRSNIADIDEFHIRGAEVSKELASQYDLQGLKVLDIGCGLGGPCRMLAEDFNCQVVGIDVSEEFIRTAQKLSELVGLSGKTKFVHGDALALPFADGSFDVVWTQHTQMNIKNKRKFYAEIYRVLNHAGVFVYYDIFKQEKQEVTYPVPWANHAAISFLQSITDMESILDDLGFSCEHVLDQTEKGILFFQNVLKRMQGDGFSKPGISVLMGKATSEKLANLLKGMEENKIVLQSGIFRKGK